MGVIAAPICTFARVRVSHVHGSILIRKRRRSHVVRQPVITGTDTVVVVCVGLTSHTCAGRLRVYVYVHVTQIM